MQVRACYLCDCCFPDGCQSEDYWDSSEKKCVLCSGPYESSYGSCSENELVKGNGKCEQAYGADVACDEKSSGEYCGTLGRCTSNCSCYEGSDSDNGINYLVKGTVKGTVVEGGSYSCQSKTDYCVDSKTVREYYINYIRLLVYQDYDCSWNTLAHKLYFAILTIEPT